MPPTNPLTGQRKRSTDDSTAASDAPPALAAPLNTLVRAMDRLSDALARVPPMPDRAPEPDYVFEASRSYSDTWVFTIRASSGPAFPPLDGSAAMFNALGSYLAPTFQQRVMRTLLECPRGGRRRVALALFTTDGGAL